jgi:hypothetical protein
MSKDLSLLNHQSDSYGPSVDVRPNNVQLIPTYNYLNSMGTISGLNTLIPYKDYIYGPLGYQTIPVTNLITDPDNLGGRSFGQQRLLNPTGVSTIGSPGPYMYSKKRSKKRSGKRSGKRSKKILKKKSKCKLYLQKKISKNIDEFKKGRYKSIKQAIAVSYSQTKKKFPRCSL